MNEIQIGARIFQAPASWQEASGKHLLYFFKLKEKGFSRHEILKRVSYLWPQLPASAYLLTNLFQRAAIAESFEWIFSCEPPSSQLIPVIRAGMIKLHGPGHELNFVMVDEWMEADSEITKYMSTKKIEHLNKAISILYREEAKVKTSKDIRVPFSEIYAEKNVKRCSKILPHIKQAILFNYLGMRLKMEKDFSHAFSGKGGGKNFGIPGMIHDMAGAELGTVEEVQKKWYIRNLLFIANKNEIRRQEMNANKPAEK